MINIYMQYKTGLGKDSHKFLKKLDPKKPLVIGGVIIPNLPGFQAHSDGDCLYHAVFNAVSSALGGGSIGKYFPDTSPEEKNKNSRKYLEDIFNKLKKQKYKINNLSISVEAKFPKIDLIAEEIKKNLANIFKIKISQIGITATTGEEASPWGKGLGVEVLASVLITKNANNPKSSR